ncbi:response regulator [Patescibacteria group bacterium]|nr:response regulator [Patescibacteria group bacterium]MBU1890701.1 response regulator [Patescibacteria group bacterium]
MSQAKKVLIIEDEASVIEVYKNELKNSDIELIVAEDGQVGLEKAKKEKPNAILLDLILPKMHGFEFLEKIKGDPDTQNIPVVILSNLGGEMNKTKAKDLGVDDYFVKTDMKFSEVIEKLSEHMT